MPLAIIYISNKINQQGRLYWSLLLGLLLFSCGESPSTTTTSSSTARQLVQSEFQSIMDQAQLAGSILIYDAQNDTYYSNDFAWAQQGQLPASTYKIPHTMIALETGVVESDRSVFTWDGQPRAIKAWEQDLNLRDAFQVSCVPCYQEVAKKIGVQNMNHYLQAFNYGHIQVDSSNLDHFWLVGGARISPFEQIDFLRRFYTRQLPISPRTDQLMRQIAWIETTESYRISGKTGWSTDQNQNNGWFVGFLEKEERVYYFATNIKPSQTFDRQRFIQGRTTITYQALNALGLIAGKELE
ncbi:MAG: class D beta-lactamase [Bacteroidota bacterium]